VLALASFGIGTSLHAQEAKSSKPPEKPPEKAPQAETETAAEAPIGLRGVELEELEQDYAPPVRRLIIPPYYQEKSERLTLRMIFPFFFSRTRTGLEASTELGIFPFYWRARGQGTSTDVYFPLYWKWRSPESKTDLVVQTFYNRFEDGFNFGFAPLLFLGRNGAEGTSYQVVPPLFFHFAGPSSSFLLAGIFYHRRDGDDYHLGLPPLLFAGRKHFEKYLVALPPLFWRFEDEIKYETTYVLPPAFWGSTEFGRFFGIAPLLYFNRDKNEDQSLVLPFYFGSRWQHKDQFGEPAGEGRSHYLPFLLSYYRKAKGLLQHGVGPLYAWSDKEGDTLRMFTPLLWMWGNERSYEHSTMIPPLFYRHTSPIRRDVMAGLLYWDFEDLFRKRTLAVLPLFAWSSSLREKDWRLWLPPTFDIGFGPKEQHFRIHPLVYWGRGQEKSHFVAAPIVWKFKDEDDDDLVVFPLYWRFYDRIYKDGSRIVFPFYWSFDEPRKDKQVTVGFPLYWDLRDGRQGKRTVVIPPLFFRSKTDTRATTGVLNFVVNKGEVKGNRFWTFSLFPLLSFGHPPAPSGAYWSVLGGLAGWRRQGSTKQLKILWIPFNFGD
jgi:hypothetical protein